MKKNVITLALMLVFASTTVFADGEVGHGNRITADSTVSAETSNTLLDQVLTAIYALVA